MAGLHFYCGDWMGEDKSADPVFEMIEEVADQLRPEEEAAWHDVFAPAWSEAIQAENEVIITPEMLNAIAQPLRRYRDGLVSRLGLSGPEASIDELGGFPRTCTPTERRFECVADLLEGYAVARQTGRPVVVHFC